MSNFLNVLKDVQAKRKQLADEVKAVMAEGIKQFMADHPEVKSLTWTQYTPYFCDGDACVFGVGDFYVSGTTADVSDYYDTHTEVSSYSEELPDGISLQTWSDLVELKKVLYSGSEDLEAAFGDHAQVIITQEGVDVEEYEHD